MEIDRVRNYQMTYVIADTNALILPFKRKFNLDTELDGLLGKYKLIVPDPIIGELKILAKHDRTAKAALKLAMTMEHMQTRSVGDDSVLELARELKGIIMSNDKALIKTARASGIRVIRLRETARLAFDNDWLD